MCLEDGGYVLGELTKVTGSNPAEVVLCTWQSSTANWVVNKAAGFPPELSYPFHLFNVDTCFSYGGSTLCWVDLSKGMVVCDLRAVIRHGVGPEFRLVPLPGGCPTYNRGQRQRTPNPEEFRNMACVGGSIKFVTMDGYGERPGNEPVRFLDVELGGADIPDEFLDPDFCGIDTSSDHRCHHGLNPARKVAYASQWEEVSHMPSPWNERCSWLKWIDEPWGPVLTRSTMHLWGKVAMYRDKSDELDAKKKEMNLVYLELWTERSKMESEHDQVVINLKNIIVDNEIKMARRLDFHTKLCVASISLVVTLAAVLAYVLSP
ncbi:hypothetical protein ZWY2020_007569 [Hordeum vulgare]|nr:hypothetical protein ZWY2020_007569 [Hordeum vulgare]